jgi:CHAT domain-containing protein
MSACETARTGTTLADETVHLASALHVAGYRHVIGTLCPVAGRPALHAARDVYHDLAAEGGPEHLAASANTSTRRLRGRDLPHPFEWAATVHIRP